MVISKIFVTAFKSIRQLSLPLDKKITVLIGPNESGKTNVLKATESFRPDKPLTIEHTCQYSDFYGAGKVPHIGLELTDFSREEQAKLIKMYEGFRTVDSFILRREGSKITDYKIQTNDKTFTIGNVKPLLKVTVPGALFQDPNARRPSSTC